MGEADESVQGVLPTIARILDLPAMRHGQPEVMAGRDHLDRPVRWVHVSELPDIARLLQGGELILTTGVALPATDAELRSYVVALAEAGASGVVVELGRRFTELPAKLLRVCDRHGLPLVALRREVRFVKVTEAVHSFIVSEQFHALQTILGAHEVFTKQCLEGASVSDVVRAVAVMTDSPTVFENSLHQVLAHEPMGVPTEDLLRDWEARSRATRPQGGTHLSGPENWMLAPVMAGASVWGRLVLVPRAEASPHQRMILERGAVALTLNRLLEGKRETAERHAQRSTLSDIISRRYPSAREMHARTAALGVPTARHELIAVIVSTVPDNLASPYVNDTPESFADTAAEVVAEAARAGGVPALVAALAENRIGALLALPTPSSRDVAIQRLVSRVHEREGALGEVVIGVGRTVRDLADVQLSFAEAEQVAIAARGSTIVKPYYQLPDIQLRGLLHILGEDPRVQAFVERTLAPLLEHDARHGSDLLGTLRGFLASGGNKSAAANAVHLSRQALYERLAAIERVLGVDLDAAEVRASLYAALMGLESGRQQPR